jgi:hypothetical protein
MRKNEATVQRFKQSLRKVIAEEDSAERLAALLAASVIPPDIRNRIRPLQQRIRHAAVAAEYKDWLAAKLLQVQQDILAEQASRTKESAEKLAAELVQLKVTAEADLTAAHSAIVTGTAFENDPPVQSLLTNAKSALDMDLAYWQSTMRSNAQMRKVQQQQAEARKQEQRQSGRMAAAAAAAAAGAAAATAAITAATEAAVPDAADADAAMAEAAALPLNQEQQQEQTAAAAANRTVTLNQVAAIMQQGITAGITAYADAMSRSKPPRPGPAARQQPRRQRPPQQRNQQQHQPGRATPQRPAINRQQQQPNRDASDRPSNQQQQQQQQQRRQPGHRSRSPNNQRRVRFEDEPRRQQQQPRQQQQQQQRPNAQGGPAGPRTANRNWRRTGNNANNRVGRQNSR